MYTSMHHLYFQYVLTLSASKTIKQETWSKNKMISFIQSMTRKIHYYVCDPQVWTQINTLAMDFESSVSPLLIC